MTQTATHHGRAHGALRLLKLLVLLLAAYLHGMAARPRSLAERARWRMLWCRRILSALGIRVHTGSAMPASGLIVFNHIGYMDVLVAGAITPAIFISKAEVRRWPLIGAITARGATIYLDRQSPRAAAEANRAITSALNEGLPVVLFPEGTTSGGDTLLPFHAALFEPAVRAHAAIWPATLHYTLQGVLCANASVAYFGDHVLLPHLAEVMRLRDLHAHVEHAPQPVHAGTRRQAATASHAVVQSMLQQDSCLSDPVAAGVHPAQQALLA